MHDLRLYIKDLLMEYAQLQRFDVKPSYHARCIDWERMLTEFEWPHYSKVTCVMPGYTVVRCLSRPHAFGPYTVRVLAQPRERQQLCCCRLSTVSFACCSALGSDRGERGQARTLVVVDVKGH